MNDYRAKLAARSAAKETKLEGVDYPEYQEDYPPGLDLSPGSDHTKTILNKIFEYCDISRALTDPNEPKYREMDKTLTFYQEPDAYDLKAIEKDPRKALNFVVPTTHKARDLFLTYLCDIFLREDSVHAYQGCGSAKAAVGGALYERVVARQSIWFKERTYLMTLWKNGIAYGRSRAVVNWKKKKANQNRQEVLTEQVSTFLRDKHKIKANRGDVARYVSQRTVAEGSQLMPLDPRQCFYDPSVSVDDTYDASFGGWIFRTKDVSLIDLEADPEEHLTNCHYVRELAEKGDGRSVYWPYSDEKGGGGRSQHENDGQGRVTGDVDCIAMVVHFIPESWFGRGHSKKPERWLFIIAADRIVVTAWKLDHYHGMPPYIDFAPNDGDSINPTGLLEAIQCFQKHGNMTLKSKAQAIYTVLNGRIFVDPTKVYPEDLLEGAMGQFIRVQPDAYGEGGIERYVHQMQVQDPTTGHWENLLQNDNMALEGLGANGYPQNLPDRPGSQNVSAQMRTQFSRLDRYAMITEEQCMTPLGLQMAFNTQQWMSEEISIPLIGRDEDNLRRAYGLKRSQTTMQVNPWDLDLAFEIITRSGARPAIEDTAALAELSKTMLQIPDVLISFAERYQCEDIIATSFERAGLKQIWDFEIASRDDEEIERDVDKGNLVPVNGGPQPAGDPFA